MSSKSTIKIRKYLPFTDHIEVVEICKDVYGGFDALPKVINSYVDQPDTHISVIADEQDTLQALILYQLRGDILYIWGARTRASQQGKGMGKMLLNHIETEATQLYPSAGTQATVTGFLSTTITENAPMRRIFNLVGYTEHCVVDIVSLTLENINTFRKQNLDDDGTGVNTGVNSFSLQPCTSVAELTQALQTLRRKTANASSTIPIEWLPGEYVPWPSSSSQAMSFVKENKVFFLSINNAHGTTTDTTSATNTTIEAVVFLGIGDHGSPFAGIVAASWPSLAAAIDKVIEVEKECTRLYIDRCNAIEKECLENAFGGGLRDYIVVYKPFTK